MRSSIYHRRHDMTSKKIVRATRSTFSCASPKTNTPKCPIKLTIFCVKLSINNHIVRLVHKNHILRTKRTCLMYHATCKVEFQPFKRSYSQLTFSQLFIKWSYDINREFLTRRAQPLRNIWAQKCNLTGYARRECNRTGSSIKKQKSKRVRHLPISP